MKDKTSGSKGILEGLSKNSKEEKNEGILEVENERNKEDKFLKRSYTLKESTVKKVQELKVFVYPDASVTYNEIVDEAICKLYDEKKKKVANIEG